MRTIEFSSIRPIENAVWTNGPADPEPEPERPEVRQHQLVLRRLAEDAQIGRPTVADEVARAGRVPAVLGALSVALLRLLDLAGHGGDEHIALQADSVLDQRPNGLDVAGERALHVRDPEAVDPSVALEPFRPEARDVAQPRLLPRVRGVEVAVEHQRGAAAFAGPGADDVRPAVLDLLPHHLEAQLLELAGHDARARLLRPREGRRRDQAQREVDQSPLVDHRNFGRTLLAEHPDLLVAPFAPELEHHMGAAGVPVLLDRGDAVLGGARDRLALVEQLVRHLILGGEAAAPLHRLRDRPDLLLVDAGELEERVRGSLDVLHLVREVHAGDLARAVAALVTVLSDRRDHRAADVDVACHVLPRVADEGRRRDRRRQAAVPDLARERLHLRCRRGDVDRGHLSGRVRRAVQGGDVGAPRAAVVLERLARKHALHDRDRVAHGPQGAIGLLLRVVQEDLRRAEAEEEPARPGSLLDDAGVHRHLHGVPRERRDDPPADRESAGLSRHQRRDDRGRPRLHPVLAPPGVGLGEPDRVHPGLVHDPRRLEHLVERLHRQLHDPDAERRWHEPILESARIAPCS